MVARDDMYGAQVGLAAPCWTWCQIAVGLLAR